MQHKTNTGLCLLNLRWFQWLHYVYFCYTLKYSAKNKSTSPTSGSYDAQYSLCCHCRLSHTEFRCAGHCDVCCLVSWTIWTVWGHFWGPSFVGTLSEFRVRELATLRHCVCACACVLAWKITAMRDHVGAVRHPLLSMWRYIIVKL